MEGISAGQANLGGSKVWDKLNYTLVKVMRTTKENIVIQFYAARVFGGPVSGPMAGAMISPAIWL
jgi:hypothetical protein